MPNRVELSAAAKADLADILDYGIERFGLDEAVAFRINLLEHLDHIAEYPESYAENRDLTPPARVSLFSSYVILYRYIGQDVFVGRIRHHAEDWR
jgi:toxin ParE1/3/4